MENTFEKIHAATLHLLSADSFEEACKIAIKESQRLVSADYGSLWVWTKEKLVKQYDSSSSLAEIVMHEKHVQEITPLGVKSSISIPLLVNKKKFGVIVLLSLKQNYFSNKEKKLLISYAVAVSLLLKKASRTRHYKEITYKKRRIYFVCLT